MIRILIPLLLVLPFQSCKKEDPFVYDLEKAEYSELILKIQDFLPTDFLLDENNNIYITNNADQTIEKYSPDGKLLKSTGGTGRGPGEYSKNSAIKISSNDSHIIAHEVGGYILNKYDFNLNIIASHTSSLPIFDSFITHNNKYVLFYFTVKDEEMMAYKDSSFTDIHTEFNLLRHYNIFIRNIFFPAKLPEDKFLVSYAFINQVRIFTLDGELLQWFKIPGIPDEVTEFKVPGFDPNITGFSSPQNSLFLGAATNNGNIYLLEGDFSTPSGSKVHLFDIDSAYLKTLKLPSNIHLMEVKGDHLYGMTIDSSGTSIVRFSI